MEHSLKYFKQYGEIRTGTNYLKRLVELNFHNVTVFGSILGWKHGTYDLGNMKDSTASHDEWLTCKTKGGVVYSVDNLPVKYKPDELKSAIPKLQYIFSIKKPVPFILSFKKFRQPNRPLTTQTIINMCKRYNTRYRDWLHMYENNSSKSIIVPYESVLHNYTHVLFAIESKFNLNRKHTKYINEDKVVKASTDVGLIIDKQLFNTKFYLEEEYLNELTDSQVDCINSHIDHEIVKQIYNCGV